MLQIKIVFISSLAIQKTVRHKGILEEWGFFFSSYRPWYVLQSCCIETISNFLYCLQWEKDSSSYYVRLMMTTWWLKHQKFSIMIYPLIFLKAINFFSFLLFFLTFSLFFFLFTCFPFPFYGMHIIALLTTFGEYF